MLKPRGHMQYAREVNSSCVYEILRLPTATLNMRTKHRYVRMQINVLMSGPDSV